MVVVVLAWRRMARIADVLETRVGGLWIHTERGSGIELWFEQPFAKTAAAGSWDRLLIHLSAAEWTKISTVVRIEREPPTIPPPQRPLMFPGVKTPDVAAALAQHFGRRPGAHALRRSAMRTALESGLPLPQVVLLSLHASVEGALAYILRPDVPTADAMVAASRATAREPFA